MGHRQRRAQFSDAMVRQRRRHLGSDVDQVEGQRPGQSHGGPWQLGGAQRARIRYSERSEESLSTNARKGTKHCVKGFFTPQIRSE